MAELSKKKKHMIIALIAALIIGISVIVTLMVLGEKKAGNTENSKNREVYSEEEILDKCIEAINEGDGKRFLEMSVRISWKMDMKRNLEH